MPLNTRAISGGIPPRVHEPKKKQTGKKKLTTKRTKNRKKKRQAESESESESDDSGGSLEDVQEATPEPTSRKKGKKRMKMKHHVETEDEEVQIVDDVELPAQEPEMVEDSSGDEQQVSMSLKLNSQLNSP